MSKTEDLELRVKALEAEAAELRKTKADKSVGDEALTAGRRNSWVERVAGSFSDDPDFDEIVCMGAEIRRNMRPETHG